MKNPQENLATLNIWSRNVTTSRWEPTTRAWISADIWRQDGAICSKNRKSSHIMVSRASQDLRSPSSIWLLLILIAFRWLNFKGSRWKLIHLLKSLGVLFEHPTTAHSTILELEFRVAQWRHARRPSLQHGFQNGGRSNCSGTELSALTVRLKGKFTS